MAQASRKQFTELIDDQDYVLNFQRHEFKYFIPKSAIEILVLELLQNMNLDAFSRDGYYNLYSIYYDTQDWQSYYEKLDGIERRKKFRIRSYAADPRQGLPIMLEIKEKNKDIILKRRTPINFTEIEEFERGMLTRDNDEVFDEWRYGMIRNNLKPKILIAYERLAFEDRSGGDTRIDRNVKSAFVNSGNMFNAPLSPTYFSRSYSVLEVKFGRALPRYALELIRRHSLFNEAISKYTESVITKYRAILK